MRKSIQGEKQACESTERHGRVLARVLAEDLRRAHGGGGDVRPSVKTNTATDLGDRLDFTFRGGDGDAF